MGKQRLTIKKVTVYSKAEAIASAKARKPKALGEDRIFGGVPMSNDGKYDVKGAHYAFENFWRKISALRSTDEDKEKCLDKLKEACFWMCRGISRANSLPWKPEEIVEQEDKKEETSGV